MTVAGLSGGLVWCEWYEGTRRRISLFRKDDIALRGPDAPGLFDHVELKAASVSTAAFHAGDLVQHESGGPVLCVKRCGNSNAECEWSVDGLLRVRSFALAELHLIRAARERAPTAL